MACKGDCMHTTTSANVRTDTKPEWLRLPDATRIFGLSRSTLYELIADNRIRSTALKKRGSTRGIRIISYDSLAAFLNEAANGNN